MSPLSLLQVWATAHFTHFTAIGDRFLPHGAGAGKLAAGGSFVSLVDGEGGLTIVVQKASHEHSRCIRPALAPCVAASCEGAVVSHQKGGQSAVASHLDRCWAASARRSNRTTKRCRVAFRSRRWTVLR